MSDPAIKLFGRTIALLEAAAAETAAAGEPEKVMGKETKDIENDAVMPDVSKEVANADPSYSGSNNVQKDDQQANVQDDKIANDSKSEEVKTEDDRAGQEKVLKKPDKILPCPRCNSMDTKFCYYNNYNVNQPRHFCKNCQRYWTAGGTMRNVPVGAGRRKNKHASHYRHIMMPSDDMVASRGDISDLMHHQALPSGTSVPVGPLKGNETLLKFGPEAPLCDSMATVLNIAEQKKNADFASVGCGDNREEQSCESSVVASSNRSENGLPDNAFNNDQNGMPGYCNGLTLPHVQCYSAGAALMLPWSPGWNNVAAMTAARCSSELVHGSENGNPNPLSWTCPSMMATPGFCAPAVPFPVVPPSFWGCMPGWPNGMWGAPWPGCNGTVLPSSPTSNSSCSGNGSPTLGKHSRDTSMQAEEKMEKNLWVPKTLRIDDPDEAAKSSIWATLGIKPDEKGIFKPFQSNGHKNGQTSESAQVLHANPAAFSRSQSFQEGT